MALVKPKLLLSVLCSASLLAACQSKGAESATPPGETKVGESKSELQKVLDTPTEVVIYGPSTTEDFMLKFGSHIQKKFPNFTIKHIDKSKNPIDQVLIGNQPIDIIIGPSVGTNILQYGLQNDISDLIKKYNYDLTQLQPNLIQLLRDVGGVYGLPYNIATYILLYNKDLFDKFGVPYPKDGMLWDDLHSVAQRMSRVDSGVQYRGFSSDFWFSLLLNQRALPVIDAQTSKAAFTSTPFAQLFENMARFYKIPGNEPVNKVYNDKQDADYFMKDKVAAMRMDTIGGVKSAAQAGINFNVAQVPVFKDLPNTGFNVNPSYFFITSRGKQRDAAFQILTYIASAEWQEWQASNLGVTTVRKDAAKVMQQFGKGIPELAGKTFNVDALIPKEFPAPRKETAYDNFARAELSTALADYLSGIDLNTALRSAAERTNSVIATKK
ncbi:MAG: transporter substrate-binding protein [Paenibacillus sp.]|jgi:multiple sugar transport system substrate-binding protein|nr:transporter substrate-binding protein [Paenibacillus sp.]